MSVPAVFTRRLTLQFDLTNLLKASDKVNKWMISAQTGSRDTRGPSNISLNTHWSLTCKMWNCRLFLMAVCLELYVFCLFCGGALMSLHKIEIVFYQQFSTKWNPFGDIQRSCSHLILQNKQRTYNITRLPIWDGAQVHKEVMIEQTRVFKWRCWGSP